MLSATLIALSLAIGPGYEALNALANQQFRAGNFDQALQTYRRALAAARVQRGSSHPATAMMLSNVAGVHRALGHNTDARSFAQQAVASLEKTLGPKTEALIPSLNTLGEIAIEEHNYAQAETYLKRAVRLSARIGGAHYATSLHNLAALSQMEGKLDRAAALYEKALQIRLKLFGPNDQLTLTTARNLSNLDQASARFARAIKSKPAN